MTSQDDQRDGRVVVFTISSDNMSTSSNDANTCTSFRGPTRVNNGDRTSSHHRSERSKSLDDILPHADYYSNDKDQGKMRRRPTLMELHTLDVLPNDANGVEHLTHSNVQLVDEETATVNKKKSKGAVKFGWITGVLVRCILNIFGVMLFMRLSWVTAQAGIGLATVIVLLACTVTFITGLSMSAISTNGEIRGGGAYYMISRSLGPEFGGSIGIIFALANAVAAAMYVIGFAETIRDLFKEFDMMPFSDVNAVRIIGLVTVTVLVAITMIGLDWEARAQLLLLLILTVAILNVMVGSFLPPTADEKSKGFLSYQGTLFIENFGPDFRDGHGFFSVFAIFFPAATGILAGANISGDLKDPQRAIPKGTMLAIFITTVVYLVMCWMAGLCNMRDACGPMPSLPIMNDSIVDVTSGLTTVAMVIKNGTLWCDSPKFGIQNDMQAMQIMAGVGEITIAGIISATLSSALASIVSAPKVFQAVCRDKIFPYIGFFGKGYGKGQEPLRGYILTFFIAAGCVCIGDLNSIAPLISNFFLASYGLINYSCFDASLAKSPGWRPAFKYYSKWLSLFGAVLCLIVMFLMDWRFALATIGLVVVLYMYVFYRKKDINWGSSSQAHVYRRALNNTQSLNRVSDHVKNYRPQVLVLTGFPSARPLLVDLCENFTRHTSLMICGHVIIDSTERCLSDNQKLASQAYKWLDQRRTKGFYSSITAPTLRAGVQSMMQVSGVGKVRPNVLVLGFKSNWKSSSGEEVNDYFNVIHDAFDLNYGVGIVRVREGLDYSHLWPTINMVGVPKARAMSCQLSVADMLPVPPSSSSSRSNSIAKEEIIIPYDIDSTSKLSKWFHSVKHLAHAEKDNQGAQAADISIEGSYKVKTVDEEKSEDESPRSPTPDSSQTDQEIITEINRFHRKQQHGTIDVWWLFDDGGLTLLIPHLLSTKKRWKGCKLRVFMTGSSEKALEGKHSHMASLLRKFRIEYSMMKVITDLDREPRPESVEEFNRLISTWTLKDGETHPWKISTEELAAQAQKTNRQIRLRELLHQHSMGATLVVVTLPMPRKGQCSAGLYMAWLDLITYDMPPIMLLRGNQESVLTYYS